MLRFMEFVFRLIAVIVVLAVGVTCYLMHANNLVAPWVTLATGMAGLGLGWLLWGLADFFSPLPSVPDFTERWL